MRYYVYDDTKDLASVHPCLICGADATHTIQADGGTMKFFCEKDFNKEVRQLKKWAKE